MACDNSGYPTPTTAELNARGEMTLSQLEAVLCGALTVDASILDLINWHEAGVTYQTALKWWDRHQDRRRREQEKIVAERQDRVNSALSKLSPEEIEALRINRLA